MTGTHQRGASGYVVVGRIDLTNAYPDSEVVRRTLPVNLSLDEVIARYKGFDGAVWPGAHFDDLPKNEFGLVDASHFGTLKDVFAGLRKEDRLDLIYLAAGGTDRVPDRTTNSLLGYDFGYFASPVDKFSVILNEVIFGQYEELRRFGSELNQHLLLPSYQTTRFLAAARSNLHRRGADLEADIEPVSVAIFEAGGFRVEPNAARPIV
jgi:hypothetical protein